MARETIYYNTTNPEAGTTRFCPQIIWQRGQFAQIGIVPEDSADSHEGGFFTDSLDRTQLNQMIALLRRARDSVHGADA